MVFVLNLADGECMVACSVSLVTSGHHVDVSEYLLM